jgi:serine/threonine-protein kinase
MPIAVGERLGPYEILAPIGAGGMGEVWKARDTRLGRDVAIKISHQNFTARFEQEARAIAALSHPHICHLYDVCTSSNAPNYLVMELVDGVTLKGPLPLNKAVEYAGQILDALDAAHQKAITHRDLKPANILLTKQGIKLLDFGLAKQTGIKESDATVTQALTSQGQILGTLQYMSPEQLQGKEADPRSDLFSFGCVLYELLTGKRAFDGSSAASVIAAILEREPAPMPAPTPVDRILKRCLAKDPDQRFQTARDLKAALNWALEQPPPVATNQQKNKLPWVVAGVLILALVAAGAGWYNAARPAPLRPLVRLEVDLGADVALGEPALQGSNVTISPDGTRLVYTSGNPPKLFTRRLDQPKAAELPGTQGAIEPFFSPDGQWIGFQSTGKLNKISVEGGAVVPLGDFAFAGASWGEDGYIYMGVRAKGLVRIGESGGTPETVAALGNEEAALTSPQILPGGKAILFSAYTTANPDAASIRVMTLADHHPKTVSRGGTSPRYLATSNGIGHLVYLNKATLFAVPFDLDKLETRGTALPILDDVDFNATFGHAQLSVSRGGTLVYRKGGGGSGLLTVAWLASDGKTQPLLAKPGVYGRPSLSPDGQRLALEVTEGSGVDIWVYDWQRDTMTRLTFDGKTGAPVWSPDGRYIVFRSTGEGMFVTRSDGAGKAQLLVQSKNNQGPWSFAADGKRMAFHEQDSKTAYDLWTVPIESDGAGLRAGKPEAFLQTPADERYPSFSPDGRWLAYMSNESGTRQIYVRAFPDKGGKWQISNNGGEYPMWSRSDLFFETADQHIMAAAYTVKGDSFVAGKPRLWSEKPMGGTAGTNKNVDLASDGKRIVALMPATEAKESQESQNHVVFLLNFFDELRRRAPATK